MTFDEIVAKVGREFDSSSANTSTTVIQEAVQARYKRAVIECEWLKAVKNLGPVVADQAQYPVDRQSIAHVLSVQVGSMRYGLVSSDDLWDLQSGAAVLQSTSGEGMFAEDAQADGTFVITLYPTPDSSMAGLAVNARCALEPTPLATGTGANSTPIIPPDTHAGLAHGAIAEIMLEVEERPDLASVFEQKYEGMIAKLQRRAKRMIGGGAVQVRLA